GMRNVMEMQQLGKPGSSRPAVSPSQSLEVEFWRGRVALRRVWRNIRGMRNVMEMQQLGKPGSSRPAVSPSQSLEVEFW
ncbi:hypothetical protein VB932_22910, partial [Salmonella enterica subsp. enterica serovar Give]